MSQPSQYDYETLVNSPNVPSFADGVAPTAIPDTPNAKTEAEPAYPVKSLVYPKNGGNDHYVRFYINVNEESRLTKIDKTVLKPVDYSDQNRLNTNQASEQAIKAGTAVMGGVMGTQLAAAVTSQKMKDLFKQQVPMSKNYKKAVGGAALIATGVAGVSGAALGYAAGSLATAHFGLTNKLYRLASSITLYTPGNIQSNYSMAYDMPEDLLTNLAQQDQYESIGKALKGTGDANRGVTSTVARIIASKNKTVSMLSKTAVNPKRDVMFKHVNNRQFNFDYVFAPRTADEAREVANIIYMFKFFAHPEMLQGYGNFLYLYPAEFDIEYGIRDATGKENINKNLNRISSCVLQSINVNYAPNGSYQSLSNGEPVVTTMNLNFMEIEALHQGRIQKGY